MKTESAVREICLWLSGGRLAAVANLKSGLLVRSSERSDRLVSPGFWSKMCDVSVKRLTMVSLMVCGCVFDFGCHQCEFDFSQVSPK